LPKIQEAEAATCTSNASGNWNTAGTWSCGHVPLVTDDVVIAATHTVTMDLSSGATGLSLTINGTLAFGSNAYTLTISTGGVTINSGGNITGTAASIITTSGSLVANSTSITSTTVSITMTGASKTISGTGTVPFLTINNTVTNNGTLTVSTKLAGSSTLTNGASATLNIGATAANLILTTLTATANGNTVNYYLNGAQTCKVTQYWHLILSGGGTKTCAITSNVLGNMTVQSGASASTTWTVGASVTINGNLTVTGSASYVAILSWSGTYTVTVSGNLSIGYGSLRRSSGTDTMTVTGTLTVPAGTTADIQRVAMSIGLTSDISGSLNTSTSTTGALTFTGKVTVAATTGSFANSMGKAISFGGGIDNYNSFNSGIGATTLTASQALGGNAAMTFAGAVTINSNFTLTNNNTNVVTFSGAITGGNAASNYATGLNSDTKFYNTVMATGILTPYNGVSTVEYDQAGAQSIKTPTTNNYWHLKVGGTSGAKSAGAGLTVNGDFTIEDAATFTTGAYTHNFLGNWIVNTSAATPITATGSTINFNTPGTPTATSITGTNTNTLAFITVNVNNTSGFSISTAGAPTTVPISASDVFTVALNVTVTNNGTATFTNSLAGSGGFTNAGTGTLNIGGSIDITTLTATASGNTVKYNSTTQGQTVKGTTYVNLTIDKSGKIATLGGITTVNGTLLISAGTLDVGNGLNYALNLNGDYTNNGAFTAQAGTVTLSGSAKQTLSGTMTDSSAFYDLTITNNSGSYGGSCGSISSSVDFNAAATVTHNYTIITASVKVKYQSLATYTFTNINWSGSNGNPIVFRNSEEANKWNLNVSGTQTVHYVDVSHSDASGGNQINAYDGTNTDCNNNTKWAFTVITLSILVSPTSWGVGTVDAATTQISTSGNKIGVTNDGNVAETFTLQISDEDDRDEWTHSSLEGGAGNNVYVLSGIFCAISDSPTVISFNEGDSEDVLTMSTQTGTSTKFGYTAGTQNGVGVAISGQRSLWLRLDMPSAVSGTYPYDQHAITVRIGCQQP